MKPVNVVLRFLLHANGDVFQEWAGRPGIRPVESPDLKAAVYEEYEEMAHMARAAMTNDERQTGRRLMKRRRKTA